MIKKRFAVRIDNTWNRYKIDRELFAVGYGLAMGVKIPKYLAIHITLAGFVLSIEFVRYHIFDPSDTGNPHHDMIL